MFFSRLGMLCNFAKKQISNVGLKCNLRACHESAFCKGFCSFHYQKLIHDPRRKIIECKRCENTSINHGRGYCQRCYKYLVYNRLIKPVKRYLEAVLVNPRLESALFEITRLSNELGWINYLDWWKRCTKLTHRDDAKQKFRILLGKLKVTDIPHEFREVEEVKINIAASRLHDYCVKRVKNNDFL